MIDNDTYKTIAIPSKEILYKDKNSKFYGYAFPIVTEEEVKIHLDFLKKKHHSVQHWCYAYQLGTLDNEFSFRANDDGEPNNSAGMPIYGQIQSFGVTQVLIVVVRYFGGVKLGVGGLITAYKTAAQMAMEASEIIVKTINLKYLISFEYKNLNRVMRIIKEKNLTVVNQVLELECHIQISVRLNEAKPVFMLFDQNHEISIKVLND